MFWPYCRHCLLSLTQATHASKHSRRVWPLFSTRTGSSLSTTDWKDTKCKESRLKVFQQIIMLWAPTRAYIFLFESWVKPFCSLASLGKEVAHRPRPKLALCWQGFGSIHNVGRARSCWAAPLSLGGEVEKDFSPVPFFRCLVRVWCQETKQRKLDKTPAWSINLSGKVFFHIFVFPSNILEGRQLKLQYGPGTILSASIIWKQE